MEVGTQHKPHRIIANEVLDFGLTSKDLTGSIPITAIKNFALIDPDWFLLTTSFNVFHKSIEGLTGRLTGLDDGDDVKKVVSNIDLVSIVLSMRGKLPKHDGPFEYIASTAETGTVVVSGIPLRGKLSASLAPDPTTGAWKLRLEPPSLLDAIWLQLGQAITSDADLRLCALCGNPFEAGGKSGRRADAKFCSDECRINYNSLKRSHAQ